MKPYLDVINKILSEGREKESGRENMPNTIGISKADISMDMADGFPLLTTKKMFWKGIVHELLWFIRGETNIKYLVENGVNIWNGDAYRWYLKYHKKYTVDVEPMTMEEFVNTIKTMPCENRWFGLSEYRLGDLGKVYGHQWRNQNGVDQVNDVFEGLEGNPYSRYHIIDGWNKRDFPEMALPPCHLLYQFIVRPLTLEERDEIHMQGKVKSENNIIGSHEFYNTTDTPKYYLDLNMYQRSCDTALGVPFNLASMSLLLMLVAKATGMIPGVANWIGGDTHLYVSHVEKARQQTEREPKKLPKMLIKKDINCLEDIEKLTIDDFELVDYESHPKIEFELFTGVKKK